jgi:hypothetical protein
MAELTELTVGTTMMLIHHAVTRGLKVCVERGVLFAQDGYPDAATRAGFGVYARALVAVVRGHHMSEDAVAFPYLRAKLPDVPFDELMADHRVMDTMLDELEVTIEAVATEAAAAAGLDDLTRIAASLSELWHPHIGIEEERCYAPEVISVVMDAEEDAHLMQALGAYAQEHVVPLSLGMPFLLYNLASPERATYVSGLPPVVTEQLVPVVWKEQWAPMQPFLLD